MTAPETTAAYQHRWQREAAHALAAMLAHGHREGLPALQWSIATTGALVGTAPGLASTPAEQRAAFNAWADYLGANRRPERTTSDGTTYLHAQFTWHQDHEVMGAVRADIFPTDGVSDH
ncbi:hypothetical protein QFW82_20770 [Streptomyces malaysiensis subsp. malaysiensis]|uniref:hypothetical protein n=1 Tax=Streptomyces malaysiensis TaxID=92644 RepID=UPI0024C0D916|nr:hypothetical protein [Streptomyces sp. NA07423]WHX19314.1 hypothetical protein QFW82_20770 [Streptomyces sp. NA07423]